MAPSNAAGTEAEMTSGIASASGSHRYAVARGMIVSTALNLVVVPAMYLSLRSAEI